MKKVLIISGSPRKDGNTEALAERFAAGAAEAGHEVEVVHLHERDCYYLIANAGFDHHQDSTVAVLDGFIACLRTVKVKGMVQASRVMFAGDIEGSECLAKAYDMGKNC